MKTTTYFQHLLIIFSIIVIVSCVCAVKQASAQAEPAATAIAEIKPLKIGDEVPDELWDQHFPVVSAGNDQTQMLKLGDYKDKLIILDFWATWCGSCIAAMPKMHHLQDQFKDKVLILPVTYENDVKAQDFFITNKVVKDLNLTSVVNDDLLRKIFPHKILPNYVWIDTDGQVKAMTSAEEVTYENIQSVLKKRDQSPISMKMDIDPNRPLFVDETLLKANAIKQYSILIKGFYSGLASMGLDNRSKAGVVIGKTITNRPLVEIYESIIIPLFEELGDKYNRKKRIFEFQDSLACITFQPTNKEELYSYSYWGTEKTQAKLNHYMLEELNRHSGYYGKIEKRKISYLELIPGGDLKKIKATKLKGSSYINDVKDNKYFRYNYHFPYLVNLLNSFERIKLPVIDSTGFTESVDIILSLDPDLETLKKELKAYNLKLVEKTGEMYVFILTDTPKTKPY